MSKNEYLVMRET